MGSAAQRLRMTEGEYLAFERTSDVRHEFADGEIFAMAGGTYEHTTVAANIITELRNALRGRKCSVQTSDMRIHIPSRGRYVYADASVVCGRPVFLDENHDTLINPRVVVEVLSPSSEEYDRGEKFALYQTLPSVMHYVLAAQDKPCIEVFTRKADGTWDLRKYGPGDQLALETLEISIAIDEVYSNVFDSDFDESAA